MFSWLPSECAWIDRVTERILTGDIVLVQSLPRWGLSTVCESVAERLQESAVLVRGRTVTENSQEAFRQGLDSKVRDTLNTVGYAQLVFDDYGHAVRHSQGGKLHSMLYRMLVDSGTARDTGALLVARPGAMIDLHFPGSPLLSRAESLVLPLLDEEDARALSIDLSALREMMGESTWLARRFLHSTPRQGRISAVEHLNNDRRRIVEALPSAAVEVLVGSRAFKDCDTIGREALLCLGSLNSNGEFEPSELVRESALLDEVRLKGPGWPASRDDSVRRFADLLAGIDNAIWVDRYLFNEPLRVREFIVKLRRLTLARLRLLISDDRSKSGFIDAIVFAMNGLDDVEVRFMSRNDRHRLHDRHLVFPATQSGVVLPTARVILGADDPGSAVSVTMPALAINYAECWARGTRVWPRT